jgi:Domain of unknown function (DUF5915)
MPPSSKRAVIHAHATGALSHSGLLRVSGADAKRTGPTRCFLLVTTDNQLTAAIDVTLTPELIEEGLVRDPIRNMQVVRKEGGLAVIDRIAVRLGVVEPDLVHGPGW